MTACDVAAICKPWEMQQVIAKLVASEFFQQGDIERNQLHVEPLVCVRGIAGERNSRFCCSR